MIYSVNNSLYTNLPNTAVTNGEYLFWFGYWQMIRDCMMGEIMVKSRGVFYLPKMESQSDDEYKAYLTRATFYNATARTLNGLVGAVHTSPPIIDNTPDTIDLSCVTNDGQSFEMFMKRITREVIGMGRYGVMIDAPPDGGTPYFVGYDCEDIVDWATVRIGSRDKLQYVVLREIIRTRSPFRPADKELTETYRVLLIDDDGIYKQRIYSGGNLQSADFYEVVPLMQGHPMTEIPFLMIGPYDFGYDCEKPPMLDIALLNLSHYRSYAQLEAGRFYTATPIYTVSLSGGGDDDAEFKIGPNTVWQLGQGDKAEIMEFKGSGLQYLENAISTKEQQIAALGGKMATNPTGVAAESADSVIARERGEASFLGSVVATMSEAASRLLSALASWHGTPASVNAQYASDATKITLDGREIRAMAMLYDTGLLPMETIYGVFRHNNIIPSGVTLAEFKSMLPDYSPKVSNQITVAEATAKIDAKYAPPPTPGGFPPKKAAPKRLPAAG
jgi:hypothetical protein